LLKASGAGIAALNVPDLSSGAIADARPTLAQLLDRGRPEIYTGDELNFIGMPIGGFFAGTVYLGGDGQLWNWDIFNQSNFGCIQRPTTTFMGETLGAGGGANYVDPVRQQSPFHQRWELILEGPTPRSIQFGDIRFRGEYPVAKIDYTDANADVEMSLEAFSPFCPLDVGNSSFPATTLTFRVKNVGKSSLNLRLQYETENPVLLFSKRERSDFSLIGAATASSGIQFAARKPAIETKSQPDILFENWSSGTYNGWVAEGTAFGSTPRKVSDLPSYMGNVEAGTEYVVNSHQTRNGEDVAAGDAHTGTLTSPAFTIQRQFINLRVGGGSHAGGTCVNLLVNGKVVHSITGHNSNAMRWESLNVGPLLGKEATLQVVDSLTGSWGNISLGEVEFSDRAKTARELEELGDFGSFCVEVAGGGNINEVAADRGTVGRKLELAPGASANVTFVVAWNFPNCDRQLPGKKNWYASRWRDAAAVAADLVAHWPALQRSTRAWNETWYDSTLPYWFLDRTFVNTSILATITCHRLDEGRFYFWEGSGCCAGTCTHVWGYAQALGRLFPEIERYLRKEIDFGEFFHPETGAIDYRGEFGRMVFVDGQASCILRAYREHQMSADDEFLRSIWPQVKKATQYLIRQDPKQDGILEGAQFNTLDTAWYGEIAWTSSLYVAALRAAQAMAKLMGDAEFEKQCGDLALKGSNSLVSELFNGEYFINHADPNHPEANNTHDGCHIDQIYGQSWALQVGLPRIVPEDKAVSALKALYRHNFYDDVWEYRRKNTEIPGGRWYATPKESGLIMCSFPHGGAGASAGKGSDAWAVGYFNECMTGFEYQVANHMIAEGMLDEGLQIVHAIHQRYHPSKRNPYNEVECSDHYGRAMASYGAFISACGFSIDGPRHEMAFAPRVPGKRFDYAFVNERGWGVYRRSGSGKETVEYRYRDGSLTG
jgi:uncharacterized protein (DUF608 family)